MLNGLLFGGRIPYKFPHCAWKEAVQDYLDGKPLIEITSVQSFQDVIALLPPGQHGVLLITKDGAPLTDREVTSLRSNHSEGCSFPLDLFIVHEVPPSVKLPKQVRVDCTALGGHDLGGTTPWHMCLRTDRHAQSVYGPSVAAIEAIYNDGYHRPTHTVALGLTKAMNEFLVMHYFAILTVQAVGMLSWMITFQMGCGLGLLYACISHLLCLTKAMWPHRIVDSHM